MNAFKGPLIAIAIVLGGLAGPGAAVAGEPYHLGVALGLSGTGGPYSQDALRGIEIAVEEINAAGGFLGEHPVELFVANTRTRPDIAELVVNDLIEKDKVRAVVDMAEIGAVEVAADTLEGLIVTDQVEDIARALDQLNTLTEPLADIVLDRITTATVRGRRLSDFPS